MIKSHEDYVYYKKKDRKALGYEKKKSSCLLLHIY